METKRVSKYWTSQAGAREIVAAEGCRVCTWRYPGEILDVAGDLWCEHCVEEALGLRPGIPASIPDLEPALIP